MRIQTGETLFITGIMILGALMFYLTFDLPPSWYQPLGAAVYARVIVSVLEILCLVVVIQGFGKTKGKKDARSAMPETDKTRPPMLASGLMVLAYGLAVTFIGYFVSSFIFMILFIFVLSARSFKVIPKAVAVGLVVMTTLYIFLKYFLNLYFPETWLF
jgi:putative tricarboxylic transport membrane protein